MENVKKKGNFGEKATYFYIKNFKKWMFCPACKKGKMIFNKKKTIWICEDCAYHFSEEYFLNDSVFWFCDECEIYLNNQDGFDLNASKHICRNCGYENDITFDNIKGTCLDCGKLLSDSDATLCVDCKQVRREKAKQWLFSVGKSTAKVVVVTGVAAIASLFLGGDESTDNSDEDDEGEISMKFSHVTDSWLQSASEDELRETAAEMEKLMDELDEEQNSIYGKHIDVVNTIFSRFPLNLPHREHGWYLPNDDD